MRPIDLDPFSIRTYLNCSAAYLYLGKYQTGCRLLEQALALEPRNWRLRLGLVRQLILSGELTEAERELEKAGELKASSPSIRRYQAWLLAAQGRNDLALSLIEPDDRLYRYEITSIFALAGKKEEAIRYIAQGIRVGFAEVSDFLYSLSGPFSSFSFSCFFSLTLFSANW